MHRMQKRTRFNPAPTAEYASLVSRLARLPSPGSSYLYADVAHNQGEHFARARGLTRGKLSAYNVGRILVGIPEQLREVARPQDWADSDRMGSGAKSLFKRAWDENAARARRVILKRLATCQGWMDHGQLFLKAGRPYCLVGHPYQLDAADINELVWLGGLWSLSVLIDSASWYYPGQTVRVELSITNGKEAGPDDR